jgi:hypothetical protein
MHINSAPLFTDQQLQAWEWYEYLKTLKTYLNFT